MYLTRTRAPMFIQLNIPCEPPSTVLLSTAGRRDATSTHYRLAVGIIKEIGRGGLAPQYK